MLLLLKMLSFCLWILMMLMLIVSKQVALRSDCHQQIIRLSNPSELEKCLREELHRLHPLARLVVEVPDVDYFTVLEIQRILNCFLRHNPSICVKYASTLTLNTKI